MLPIVRWNNRICPLLALLKENQLRAFDVEETASFCQQKHVELLEMGNFVITGDFFFKSNDPKMTVFFARKITGNYRIFQMEDIKNLQVVCELYFDSNTCYFTLNMPDLKNKKQLKVKKVKKNEKLHLVVGLSSLFNVEITNFDWKNRDEMSD